MCWSRVDDLLVEDGRVVGVQLAAPPIRCERDESAVDRYLDGARPDSLFQRLATGEEKS